MDINEMNISLELRKKAEACKTPEELLALAKQEGYKLTEEELEAMSGGRDWGESCGQVGGTPA